MHDPSTILTWLDGIVKGMRRSRRKTLASIVSGAMRLQGAGVLALGRSMEGPAAAKHRIKRVDRFLGNEAVETDAVSEGLFHALRPRTGPVVVLADWTNRDAFVQLVLALPHGGRALPFYAITVEKGDGSGAQDGAMAEAEGIALHALARICGTEITPVIIGDRGFGNSRWLGDVAKRGWFFVQRIARNHYIETETFDGFVRELGIRRGARPRDHGWGTMGEKRWGPVRLVSAYRRDTKEPLVLVTNLTGDTAEELVRHYLRRPWIEAAFRDLKNREWGLGGRNVRLTTAGRHDRHFIVMAVAYIILTAFGAAAEQAGLGDELKANTVSERVLSLARIGSYFIQIARMPTTYAINVLLDLSP